MNREDLIKVTDKGAPRCHGRSCGPKITVEGRAAHYLPEQCKRACEEGSILCKFCSKYKETDPSKWHGHYGVENLPSKSHIKGSEWNSMQYELAAAKAAKAADKAATKATDAVVTVVKAAKVARVAKTASAVANVIEAAKESEAAAKIVAAVASAPLNAAAKLMRKKTIADADVLMLEAKGKYNAAKAVKQEAIDALKKIKADVEKTVAAAELAMRDAQAEYNAAKKMKEDAKVRRKTVRASTKSSNGRRNSGSRKSSNGRRNSGTNRIYQPASLPAPAGGAGRANSSSSTNSIGSAARGNLMGNLEALLSGPTVAGSPSVVAGSPSVVAGSPSVVAGSPNTVPNLD